MKNYQTLPLPFPGCEAASPSHHRALRTSERRDVPRDKADPVREGRVPPSALWLLFSPVFLAHPVGTTGKYEEEEGKHLSFNAHSRAESPPSPGAGTFAPG